ncbi:early nodulin-like protein 17 [Typha angustifolia]|uniref:early nodulin-like protein 17 n=1 Tax=Typha angustifolia TaxID=59011 RepID=UPI003C2B1E66
MATPLLRLLLLVACAIASVSADRFTVGDSKGWNPNVNYTIWEEKHRPFHKGDWLVFYYQPGMADVVQVDEVGYNKCDASNPISNYSKGRSYAFELNQTKRYYFICSYGYCYGGMKLTVRAQALPPPSPPSSGKSTSGATPAVRSVGNGIALAFSAVVAAALLRLL